MGNRLINDIRRRNWIAVVLLWLFVSYIGGVSLFTHYHIIDGESIVHSHFYNGTAENPNHSHTSQQCKVIAALSLYITLAATTVAMIFAPEMKLIAIVGLFTPSQSLRQQRLFLLRAPPAFI